MPTSVAASAERVAALRAWLGAQERGAVPDLTVVGVRGAPGPGPGPRGAVHHRSCAIRAGCCRSGLAPAASRVVAVMPRPADLTPADTSSMVAPGLAAALRGQYPDVEELVVEQQPE